MGMALSNCPGYEFVRGSRGSLGVAGVGPVSFSSSGVDRMEQPGPRDRTWGGSVLP